MKSVSYVTIVEKYWKYHVIQEMVTYSAKKIFTSMHLQIVTYYTSDYVNTYLVRTNLHFIWEIES